MSSREEGTPPALPSLNASEIGRYVYCERSWWLQRVLGYAPENLEALTRGTVRHEQHGHLVASAHRRMVWARAFLWGALALAGILLVSWLRSVLL